MKDKIKETAGETGKGRSGIVQLRSVLTCPQCGHHSEESMPADACLFFWDCPKCHARLKPKPGDCCVFCSYGTVKCPPTQQHDTCQC